MKPAFRTTIIAILLVQVLVCIIVASSGWNSFVRTFGLYNFLLGLFGFVPGLTLALIKETRAVGQGILIACGIMLVMGFATCSNVSW
jgi:hypothetical protein